METYAYTQLYVDVALMRLRAYHMTMYSPHRHGGAINVGRLLLHFHSVINKGPQGMEGLFKLPLVTYPLSYPLGETWTGDKGNTKKRRADSEP